MTEGFDSEGALEGGRKERGEENEPCGACGSARVQRQIRRGKIAYLE